MNIQTLTIKGLHGYINKTINFNDDLTILVGINGSGKTSVLNIINWIIKPQIGELCILEFKLITLELYFKEIVYTITCSHSRGQFKYQVKNSKNENFNPLVVKTFYNPANIENDDDLKSDLLRRYAAMTPDAKEKKTWELIHSFPNTTIIGLDRSLYSESPNLRDFEINSLKLGRIQKLNVSPITNVKNIINTVYRVAKNDVLVQTNALKNELIYSTFETGFISSDALHDSHKNKLNSSLIQKAQDKVQEYFEKLEIEKEFETEKKVLNNYFFQLKDLIRLRQENPGDNELQLLYNLNAVQFKKVNKILQKFEEFERTSAVAMELINKFLTVLNRFLIDSAKQLVFKEDTAELTFNALDRNNKVVAKYKDISYLSSGEQQILILFSYLAFNSNDGRIFIIDEPELSLHIKWQAEFLDELFKMAPKGTQIILATHSPLLVDKKKNRVKLLLPYNK